MRKKVATLALLATLLTGCNQPPACWEDEVRVIVYSESPLYGDDAVGVGTLGCVPADNLPVDGYRP